MIGQHFYAQAVIDPDMAHGLSVETLARVIEMEAAECLYELEDWAPGFDVRDVQWTIQKALPRFDTDPYSSWRNGPYVLMATVTV